MRKQVSKPHVLKKAWLMLLPFVLVLSFAVSPLKANAEVELDEESNRVLGEMVMYMAALGAELLHGEYGDMHEKIVEDGHRDSEEYEAFQEVLQAIHDATGATYVYTLIKVSDDMTHIVAESLEEDEADEYGTEYEMEPQFETAFAGAPDYAIHTWEDEWYGTQKSAFAPIKNSNGDVVAILGIDYPIDDLIRADMNELVGKKVKGMAAVGALHIDRELGDIHEKIVADGHRDSEEYKQFQEKLKLIHDITAATYVYTLIKVSDDMTNIIAESLDGEDADEFGTEYEMEPQFELAFAGEPDHALHTWEDETYGTQKSAFAPIYDSDEEIVAILGIDYPAPELSAEGEETADDEAAEETVAKEADTDADAADEDTGSTNATTWILIAVIAALVVIIIIFFAMRKKK